MWDVFAVNTYLMVSILFWYMGLIPDIALLRDRSKTRVRKFIYSVFALGWTGRRGNGIILKRPTSFWPASARCWCSR